MLNVCDLLRNFERSIKINLNHYIQLSQLKVKWLHYLASAHIIPDSNVRTSGHAEAAIDGNRN
jgi:hypothetical protein